MIILITILNYKIWLRKTSLTKNNKTCAKKKDKKKRHLTRGLNLDLPRGNLGQKIKLRLIYSEPYRG